MLNFIKWWDNDNKNQMEMNLWKSTLKTAFLNFLGEFLKSMDKEMHTEKLLNVVLDVHARTLKQNYGWNGSKGTVRNRHKQADIQKPNVVFISTGWTSIKWL